MSVLKPYFLILITLSFSISCNSKHNSKTQAANETNREVNKDSLIEPYDSGDIVYKAYLDNKGNMWFGTSTEGVYKYDGENFTNYNKENGLCGNEVTSILQDKNGDFWFGTENGLCKYKDSIYTTIPLPSYNKKSAWLDKYYPMINPAAVSQLLMAKNGDLWVGSNCAGVYRYDGFSFSSHLQEKGNKMPDSMYHNSISAITQDQNGNIWIGSFSHGGITQYDGLRFIHHSLPDGYGEGMISSIYEDSKGKIWVGTRNGGIYTFNGTSFMPYRKNMNEKIPMAKFFEDSSGILWMSSYARKGVYQLKGEAFIPFEIDSSEKLIDIMTITEDKNGHIWFGGRYGLLWKYDGQSLTDFTEAKRML